MADAQKSLRAIFDEASEIEPGEPRHAYLDHVCGGDAALRADVEELLRAQETAGGFLADPKRDSSAAKAQVTEREGDRIGRYKLLQKIGEGGCGVVYMAEQMEPVRRRVALKIIKLGMDTRSVVARFEAERQALAMMDHPGIARVLDAGATETGRPFFVMELVRGIKITAYCEQNHLSTLERLRLFIQVCQAVQHAHQKGIIHRDLKPSNILVTSNDGVPLPKVIDFGIAKATADIQLTDKTLFTRFEMFIGTPAYMSPEQAEFNASDIDTRTDIYSLGVLLYELLTGFPPFDSETWLKSGIDAMRRAIRETEPTRPSTRLTQELMAADAVGCGAPRGPSFGEGSSPNSAPGVPRPTLNAEKEGSASSRRLLRMKETVAQLRGDLDWIVLKALEKDRTRRYQTATDFAADIERHLNHEPVIACPPSPLYLLRKLVRRKRAAFAIASSVALLLVTGVILSAWDVTRTRRAERTERELRAKAEQARTEADAANLQLRRTLFIREWQDAETLLEQGKTASAMAWFAHAARLHPGDFAVQTRLLSILTENTFALPLGLPFTHGAPVTSGALSADERHLITAAGDGQVRIWSLDSDATPLILPHRFSRPAVAVVPGGRVLVVDAESVSLWEMNGARVKRIAIPHPVTGPVRMTRDGQFAALNGGDGGRQLWDTTELRRVALPSLDQGREPGLVGVSPDGRYFFGSTTGARLCAWDASSGRRVWEVDLQAFNPEWIAGLSMSRDGRRVVLSRAAGAGNGELSEWKFEPNTNPNGAIQKPAAAISLFPVRSRITAFSLSQTGDRLFAGDLEGNIGTVNFATREWKTFSGEHDGQVNWMGLSADSQRLATASVDGTARLWDVRMKLPEPRLVTNGYTILDARFSPDSRSFVIAGADGAEIRDAASGELRHRLPMQQLVTHVDFSPDGRRVVAGGDAGESRVWDAQTGEPVTPALRGLPNHHVEFSRDGRWFLIVTGKATVKVHETETGRQVGPTLTNGATAVHAHFSPDGRSLVATTDHGDIEFWSLPEGQRLEKPARHKDVVWTARFSPDGRSLLTASRDRTAALWDAESGRKRRDFPHDQQVYIATFSSDGKRIATGDSGRNAHVWEVESGRRLFTLPPHPGGVWYAEFSDDGRVLLTGDDAGHARLWEASTGLPLSGWVRNGRSLKRAHLSPDGRRALSASNTGTVRVWPVVLSPLPAPAWLPELAEAVAGRRLREDGVPESVPVERWEALSASLGSMSGEDFHARWARWFFKERLREEPSMFEP